MKKTLIAMCMSLPLAFASCGGGTDVGFGGEDVTDNEILAVAATGASSIGETEEGSAITQEAHMDMNAKVMEAVSLKLESALNDELAAMAENGEITEEDLFAAAEEGKDVRVGLSFRGLTVFIEDEELPFAGGSMMLNGELGVRLRLRGSGKIALETSGDLTAELIGVERMGDVKGIPYSLSLEGMNLMEVEGDLVATIKRWKVRSLEANFMAGIVDSDVIATGAIGGRSVAGAVDMVDVSISLSNADVLHNAANFEAMCSGVISTSINENTLTACEIDEDCTGCK